MHGIRCMGDLVYARKQLIANKALCRCCSSFPVLPVQHTLFVQQFYQTIHSLIAILKRSDLVPLMQQLSLSICALLTLMLQSCLYEEQGSC